MQKENNTPTEKKPTKKKQECANKDMYKETNKYKVRSVYHWIRGKNQERKSPAPRALRIFMGD